MECLSRLPGVDISVQKISSVDSHVDRSGRATGCVDDGFVPLAQNQRGSGGVGAQAHHAVASFQVHADACHVHINGVVSAAAVHLFEGGAVADDDRVVVHRSKQRVDVQIRNPSRRRCRRNGG
ncbi:hypothetical protein D9M68_871260 [compost metagenome]